MGARRIGRSFLFMRLHKNPNKRERTVQSLGGRVQNLRTTVAGTVMQELKRKWCNMIWFSPSQAKVRSTNMSPTLSLRGTIGCDWACGFDGSLQYRFLDLFQVLGISKMCFRYTVIVF